MHVLPEGGLKLLLVLVRSYYSSLNRKERRRQHSSKQQNNFKNIYIFPHKSHHPHFFCLLLVAVIKDNTTYARSLKKFTQSNNKLHNDSHYIMGDIVEPGSFLKLFSVMKNACNINKLVNMRFLMSIYYDFLLQNIYFYNDSYFKRYVI